MFDIDFDSDREKYRITADSASMESRDYPKDEYLIMNLLPLISILVVSRRDDVIAVVIDMTFSLLLIVEKGLTRALYVVIYLHTL